MTSWTFHNRKTKPPEQWEREGKPEWRDEVSLTMSRHDALLLIGKLARSGRKERYDMTLKAFPTLAVVGAYTGRLLVEGGFGDIHEVFDHLYPGIMTLGISAMAQRTKQHLGEVMPVLGGLEEVHGDDWRGLAKAAVEMLGDTLSIDGPLENIDPLKTELDYLREHAPSKLVSKRVMVMTPGREGAG